MQPDLCALSDELRRAARIDANGEVTWPGASAADAVNALADLGRVVLGLDIRDYDAAGRFFEVPWSSFDPGASMTDTTNVEEARSAARERLVDVDALLTPEGTVE